VSFLASLSFIAEKLVILIDFCLFDKPTYVHT